MSGFNTVSVSGASSPLRGSQLTTDKFFVASRNGDASSLERLLSGGRGLDVNSRSSDGKTALAHAVSEQHAPAVTTLLRHGADVNRPSHMSYHRDHLSTQLLSYEEPPVVTAARVGNADILLLLLEQGAWPDAQSECLVFQGPGRVRDRTALHFVAEDGDVHAVRHLLRHRAAVNIEDRQRELPLHIAVRCKTTHCAKQSDIVRLLCEHGSEVNAVNKIECVPLYLASFYACLDKVRMLLVYGADVNKYCRRESSYGTALHIAAIKDRVALAEVLISQGARLDTVNALTYTPLQLNINAHSKSDIAALLIYHGARLTGIDKFSYTLLAACIRNLRLDCEKLTALLVAAGYDLNHDLWLLSNQERLLWFQNLPTTLDDLHLEGGATDAPQVAREIPDVPIPAGRVRRLCDWVRERQRSARSLMELCRVRVRHSVARHEGGRSVVGGLQALPVPAAIKHYLLLHDVYPC